MRTLIIFYSLEGSTKKIALKLAQILPAEILEIKPKKEISKNGFLKFFWGGKQALMKSCPSLMKWDISLKNFDCIIIGTPVWAFTFSPPIRSFLKEEKIENKKVALFCCHEGGMGKTLQNLKEIIGEKNTFIGEKDFRDVRKDDQKALKEAEDWAMILKKQL